MGRALVDDECNNISVSEMNSTIGRDKVGGGFNVTNSLSQNSILFCVDVTVACAGVPWIKMCMYTDFDYYNFSAVCLRVSCFDYFERVLTFRMAVYRVAC